MSMRTMASPPSFSTVYCMLGMVVVDPSMSGLGPASSSLGMPLRLPSSSTMVSSPSLRHEVSDRAAAMSSVPTDDM